MKLTVTVNGTAYDVEVEVEPEPTPTLGGFAMQAARTSNPQPSLHVKTAAEEHKVLRATISGTVTRVLVEAGQEVELGQTLLMLEAMKMESEITAPTAGTIAEVAVEAGQTVASGQVLVQWA